jgi:hypothetical protein
MRKRLVYFAFSVPALAQVAFNNAGTMHNSTSSPYSVAMSVTAGPSNLAAFACVAWDIASPSATSISSVTYGGQAMTAAGAVAATNNNYANIYYLVNPPTGSNNLVVTWSGAAEIYTDLLSFSGVNQTTPVRAYQSHAGSSANPSITISSSASPGDLIMGCVDNINTGTNQTLVSGTAGGYDAAAVDHSTVSGTSVTDAWTSSATSWSQTVISIEAQPLPPALSLSGCPSSGNYGSASTTCTVTTNGVNTFDGVHSVTFTDSNQIAPGTFTVGSSSSVGSITTTPTNGATSFTVTYTPAIVGARALTTTNTFSPTWANVTWTYTGTSAQPCTFTMTGSGAQSITATSGWTSTGGCGHSAPTTGDSLVVTASGGTMTITVPNDSVIHYLGTCPSANTTYDLQLTAVSAGSAVFDVQPGAKFYFCGNRLLTSVVTAAGSTPTVWADLKYETGATIYEDEAQASYAHRTTTAATGEWSRLLWGSAPDTCAFGPGTAYSCPTNVHTVNAGPVNPVVYAPGSTTDSHLFKIYGTAVTGGCGSAIVGCIDYETDGNSSRATYSDAGAIYLGGSVFDTTGTVQSTSGFNSPARLQVASAHFVNDLLGFVNGVNGQSQPYSCSINGSYFSGAFNTTSGRIFQGCNITSNVFAGGFAIGYVPAYPLGSLVGNVMLQNQSGGGQTDLEINVPVLFNYWANQTNAVSSNHGFETGTTNDYYRGNIYETLTSGIGEGHFSLSTSASSATVTLLDNLSLPSPSNINSAMLYAWLGVSSGLTGPVAHIDHNGTFGQGDFTWMTSLAHSSSYFLTNLVLRSLRSNLGWSSVSNAYNLGVGIINGTPSAAPNNNVDVALESNNGWYNPASSATFGSGVDTNCNPSTSLGTPYDQCTASGTPGANDITANPKLVDPTRGLFKWASVMQGQASGLAGAEAAFQGCQNLSYCVTQLETWVKTGYQPTNLAFKGKAHDGVVVGVIGTRGSGYSGACTATVTVQDADDLGNGAALSCVFSSGVPVIAVTNPGAHYRIATPAAVTISGTGGSGTSLNVVVSPSDIGPVPITLFAGVAP